VDAARVLPAAEARMTEDSRRGMTSPRTRNSEITPLLSPDETAEFRERWESLQVGFIDDPRHAVHDAKQLVSNTFERISKIVQDDLDQIEHQWSRDEEVSTDDLRYAIQRYRAFFDRLLAA
jgi:hypothetical protein